MRAVALDRERDGLPDVRRRVREQLLTRGIGDVADAHDPVAGPEPGVRCGVDVTVQLVSTTADHHGVGVLGSPKKNSQLANRIAATMKCEPGPAKITSARCQMGLAP